MYFKNFNLPGRNSINVTEPMFDQSGRVVSQESVFFFLMIFNRKSKCRTMCYLRVLIVPLIRVLQLLILLFSRLRLSYIWKRKK